MITKEKAYQIARNYLQTKKRKYSSIDPLSKVMFIPKEKIPYGENKGKIEDVYSISYGQIWGTEEKSMFITILASTGDVLYTISPHGYVEDIE